MCFVEHASGYVSIKHQLAINNTEPVKAKINFERDAQSQLAVIKGYHTDNGIFNASYFMKELLKNQQKIRFSGASASHQNGIEESAIKAVVTMERAMLIHAALRCPKYILSTDIWTAAINYAIWIYNQILGIQSGLSAIEIWSRSRFDQVSETLSNYHVWDFPAYILEPKFHKPGVNIPKWDPRSQRGVNMGFSKMHSTKVALVLNLLTGSI